MDFNVVEEVLTRFGVSKEYGFLTYCDPSKLPEYYRPWLELCDDMIQLVKENGVRQAVHRLPELSTDNLITYEDWRMAHLFLVTLTSGYIWSGDPNNAPLILPKNLCAPLWAVSERLGMRPVICHASACLANWNLIDPTLPFSLDNLQLNAFKFLNSRANHWFFIVTAQIEKDFAPCIYNIINAVLFSTKDDFHCVEIALCSIVECLIEATKTMKRMSEHLSPKEFYHYIRPYLWGYNEGALKKSGIIFEGMEEKGPFKYGGGSAAQSSTIQLIDAFLRVKHSGEERKFLVEQREHMPREHRELIYWVEAESPVQLSTKGRQEALDALVKFRSNHLNIVSQFILTQIERQTQTTGTGGSSFMKFLKNVRADTK